MITLSKSGNTVTFTFDENSGYLQNGAIDVPVNSLSLIIDESSMVTFRKSASNDIFVSANIAEFGMSKSDLETWYKENMVGATGGGGGITSGEVQTMIDESISGKADADDVYTIEEVDDAISAATDDMATETWVGAQGYITGVDLSDYATLEDIPDVSNYFDGAEYDSGTTRINFYHGNTVKAYIDASAFVIDGMIDDVRIETISGVSYLVIDFNTASGKEDIQIPLTDIFDPSNYYTKTEVDAALSGKADTTAVTESISAATSGKVDTSSVVTAVTSASTDNEIPTAKAVYDAIPTGGTSASYSAGTNISIDSANTISCTLPITKNSYNNGVTLGWNGNNSKNYFAVAEGYNSIASGGSSHAEGKETIAYNEGEHSSGEYNVSRHVPYSNFGHSGNTLFSVGNGTANNARHNAFEIRENGDIYIADTNDTSTANYYEKPMIKLQDALGGGGEVSSAITSGDTNAVAGGAVYDKFDEVESVTAAGLNALNDKFDGLKLKKLTQAQYDALSPNYDNATLYIIIN